MLPEPLVDEALLRPLVEHFYARVRRDPLLGPVFDAAVHDWNDHHARLTDFWSSVMLTSGRYKGNPVAMHMRHTPAMTAERFERWLLLWGESSDAVLPPPAATAVQAKAAKIAESLQLALFYRPSASA